MPTRISVQDATNAGIAQRMNSILLFRMTRSIGNFLTIFFEINQSKINRVTTRDVNKLAATPHVSETPKPLTEPVPMTHRMIEEIAS
jgi:hypothetical protein